MNKQNEPNQLQKDLEIACLSGNEELVIEILEKGVSPNFCYISGSPLSVAVLRNNLVLLELLLSHGADLNFSDSDSLFERFPLEVACKDKNFHMVDYLISLGAKVNMVSGAGKSILEVAVATGNREIVAKLLEAGADVEIKSGSNSLVYDKTPICAAVEMNDTEMVEYLVKMGAKTKPIRKLRRFEIHPKMVRFLKAKKYL
ncbi:ankyrin repeat domain-containing protein [Cellulophaga tyrosinoxydans]|uniref:Ankyrin repeat n=1 Tax=Cellulophaga tyrosinoxydans TaxID=504486 RepID=A0A1W2AX32_9FLAO|nr:ankyrin repeat domain-containing protein [Cellulophaga tyrosinoxydans]SMC65100.1 Ankyrin repeat [Cellulophaga tyrosinoxydans]